MDPLLCMSVKGVNQVSSSTSSGAQAKASMSTSKAKGDVTTHTAHSTKEKFEIEGEDIFGDDRFIHLDDAKAFVPTPKPTLLTDANLNSFYYSSFDPTKTVDNPPSDSKSINAYFSLVSHF